MSVDHLASWVGRRQSVEDIASKAPFERLAALLDHDGEHWRSGEVPPFGHWLIALPSSRQSEVGADGHPLKGDFLPPVLLPRRMWAQSEIAFENPIPIGAVVRRNSKILAIEEKHGASGPLAFVTVEHDVTADNTHALKERQTIVYRSGDGAAGGFERAPEFLTPPDPAGRRVTMDSIALFRYSALTFNAHRIHYDRDYAMKVEGYPGLVVHGPLIATLRMDQYLRLAPRAHIKRFVFRARKPLFDGDQFDLNVEANDTGNRLSARDGAGEDAVIAEIEQW